MNIDFLCTLIVSILLVSCHDNHVRDSSTDDLAFVYESSHSGGSYFPVSPNDSMVYIGQTHYHKSPDNFDTTYNDTIIISKPYDNYFFYQTKQLKYKWLQPLPGQSLPDIMISSIQDSFAINSENTYENEFGDNVSRSKVRIIFRDTDSLYFQDEEGDLVDKVIDKHTFRGKLHPKP